MTILNQQINKFGILFFLVIFTSLCADSNVIQFKTKVGEPGELTLDLGGKFNNEIYSSINMNFFNDQIAEDALFYARTTFDLFSTFTQGKYDYPRIQFYDVIRFRFKWGTLADVKSASSSVTIGNTDFTVSGTSANKHLLWLRESWIKIMLGKLDDHENYLQLGLIPYEVGRGISLGMAFEALGFLGFNPGSSIDQYAPAVLLRVNPIVDRFFVDFYIALTENYQTSYAENIEKIHMHEIDGACAKRGVGNQAYIAALRSKIALYKKDVDNITFEPYLVYQRAPNQDLEFANDVNSYLTTAGLCIEGAAKRFSWGIEGAKNFGELDIRAWDRNYIQVVSNSEGVLVEQNTKVYVEDPSTTINPEKAPNTQEVQQIIAGSPHTRFENGKQIGTISDPFVDIPVYNAFDRFRPAQIRYTDGYFFVADVTCIFVPKAFNASVGVGYSSGFIEQQRDTNIMTDAELMNEQFTAFIPLQSVYNGRRLRHLVLFNQGVPRFNVRLPNADTSQRNVTAVSQAETVNEFTNIAFAGVRFDWNIQALRKNQVNIAQNIIAYWSPETAHFALPRGSEIATSQTGPINLDTIATVASDNFIGTELSTEFSGMVYDKIKISGYVGCLIPGNHYKDMIGTLVGKKKTPTGKDTGFVGNISIAYIF
ncbi:hypothetical protein KAZ82_00520 [Candidatus Babeliales bacterium]|nr:hypothetical protein [Candidatus Babeliales bacterium]